MYTPLSVEIDDDDLPPDPEERDQDQTDNNPSNDHIDAVDTNHEGKLLTP